MSDEVLAKIKSIIADLLDVDESEIVPGSRFREDLEADSLDLVELIMEFEEVFGSDISDEDAQKITTVGEAVAFVTASK
jgi:acyl carrier protein